MTVSGLTSARAKPLLFNGKSGVLAGIKLDALWTGQLSPGKKPEPEAA